VAKTLEVEYCKVLELLPDGDRLLLRAGIGWRAGLVGHAMLASGLGSHGGYTLRSSSPVIVEDLGTEIRFNPPPLLREHGVVSGVSVIVEGRERPFGVLGAYTTREREFTQDDINFLQAIANVIATAIEREEREAVIRDLSTPVLSIRQGVLLAPIVGQLDVQRSQQLEAAVLHGIREQRASAVVVDVTGAAYLTGESVQRLARTVQAARLLGARVVVTGVSAALSHALIQNWQDVNGVETAGDLESGIDAAMRAGINR